MSGLFGTLGVATSGLTASQIALQTSGHNISNTTTDGYSRQRTNLQTTNPYAIGGVGQVGTGVKVKDITRVVDDFVRQQVREANSMSKMYEEKADALGQLEDYFGEPSDSALLKQMNTIYDAWSKLSSNPELGTSKTLVVENSNTFATTVNEMAQNINQLKSDVDTSLANTVYNFNQRVEELEILNKKIVDNSMTAGVSNDLLDQRDRLLKDMSSMADISTTFDKYGRVSELKVGDTKVLDTDHRIPMSVVVASVNGTTQIAVEGDRTNTVTIQSGDVNGGPLVVYNAQTGKYDQITVSKGQIGGQIAASQEIAERAKEFNQFVEKMATSINTSYSDGGKNPNFFVIDSNADNVARNLKVNDLFQNDPSKLVAGLGDNPNAGDGRLAKNVALSFSAKDAQGMTYAEHYNDIITKNGISKLKADNTVKAQQTVLDQLENQDASISGVNINEEVSNVIRFSQAFQANARVLQTVSEMLDTLINRTGA